MTSAIEAAGEVDPGRRGLRQHRVVVAGIAGECAKVGADEDHRFPRAERVADIPGRPRVWIRPVHDRDQAVRPVDPAHIGREDARAILAGLLLLRQEDLVPGGAQG
jgi:hypothetical protein